MNQNYNIPFDMRLLMLSFQQNNQNFNPFSNIFPNVMPQLAQQVQSYEFLQNWLQACNNINYGNQNKDLPPLTTPSTINQSFPLPGQSSMENLPQAYQKFLTYDKIEINFPRTSTTPLMKKNEGVFHDARKQNYQTPDSGIDSPASNQNLPESPKNDTSDVSVSTSVLTDDPSTNEPTTPTKGCNGKKKNYCYVCEKFIVNRNGRNQGPRRHVLQIHLKKPLYLCRICNYSSTYDKYHVTSHIKRIHDIDNTDDYIINNKYEQEPEVCVWYKKCFEDKLEPQ